MKTLIQVVVITCGIAVIAMLNPVKADSQTRKSYDFVIVQGWPDWKQTIESGHASYQWNGCFVYNYDHSAGAPSLPLPITRGGPDITTNGLAQTLSDLSDQGFEIIDSSSDPNQFNFVLKRLRINPK